MTDSNKRDELRKKVLDNLIEKADEYYKNNDWDPALNAYLSIAKQIESEILFINIGMCYYN